MTAEPLAAEPAPARIRRCGCGAHIEYQRAGEEAERAFSRAHYDCEATAIVDDGHRHELVAMRGLRTVACADWATSWAVYMGSQAGELMCAEVTDRAQAEAVLKLIVNAYDKGASR